MSFPPAEQHIIDQLSPQTEYTIDNGHVTKIEITELPIIDVSSLKHVKEIALHDLNLETVPDWLFKMSGLEYIDLDCNWLTEIPPKMANLSQLRTLIVAHNLLEKISPELTNLHNLKDLDLSFNENLVLPKWIGGISSLESLFISGISLFHLEADVINSLPNLSALRLGSNRIHNIYDVSLNLHSLTFLSLWDMSLAQLPSWVYESIRLTFLDISQNPNLLWDDKRGFFPHLEEIRLGEMNYFEIPDWIFNFENLIEINLYSNQIGFLTERILKLKKLKTLRLMDNPLFALPRALLDQIPFPEPGLGYDAPGLHIDQSIPPKFFSASDWANLDASFLERLLAENLESQVPLLLKANPIHSRILWQIDQFPEKFPLLSQYIQFHPERIQIKHYDILL